MEKLIHKIKGDFPKLTIVPGKAHCWSPEAKSVFYDIKAGDEGIWSLLHELGHAHLNHSSYSSDVDLLQKEALAWEEAARLAEKYQVSLDREHLEDCLDTYRDWLHKRSTCPNCAAKGLQADTSTYTCISCQTSWQVTSSRFCRPYRRLGNNKSQS